MESKLLKILIVEDDYQLAYNWKQALDEYGYYVDAVSNATDARRTFSNNYDCYIIDLFHVENNQILPEGGISLLSEIKKNQIIGESPPLVIAITGYYHEGSSTSVSTQQIVKNLGASLLLKKPVKPDTFHEVIKVWLEDPYFEDKWRSKMEK